jgi:hypothetical protein
MENRTKRLIIFWGTLGFFFLVVYLFAPRGNRNVIDQSRVADDKKALAEKNAAINAGLAELFAYKKEVMANTTLEFNVTGSRGNVLWTFTIKNDNELSIKDITVTCDYDAPSGTPLGSSTRTIYEAIKAGSTKRVKDFSMGSLHPQVKTASCRIDDLSYFGGKPDS